MGREWWVAWPWLWGQTWLSEGTLGWMPQFVSTRQTTGNFLLSSTVSYGRWTKSNCVSSFGTVEEFSQFYTSTKTQWQQQREEDLKQEPWKLHPLYQESWPILMVKLNKSGLNLKRKKYELLHKTVERSGEAKNVVNMLSERDLYDGNISSIPDITTGLMKLYGS